MTKKYIVCYSGGKDSTAMLIHLIKENKPIDEVLYVDMGEWMWNGTEDHLKQVETTLNIKITRLNVFNDIKEGFRKWGFPSFINRWCTGIKREAMKKYLQNKYSNKIVQYIGYCADEEKRTNKKLYTTYETEYPLVEAGITTEQALQLCYDYGFNFCGVYEHHSHFNCWLCPLQRVKELEHIYIYKPDLWFKLYNMQRVTDGTYYPNKTVFELEKQFWEHKREMLKSERMKARQK